MISKIYYMKTRSIINTRGTSYGVIAIRACTFVIALFACISIALALSWQDKEWEEAGCPPNAIGAWESDKPSFRNEKTINIQKNKIVIIGNQNPENNFLLNKNYYQAGDKFIEFNLDNIDRDNNNYFKVRPHLITSQIDYGNSNHNSYNCYIKVFQYNSKKT